MDDRVEFDINESLKYYLSDPASVPTPGAHSTLVDCENDPESLTNSLINSALNPIVDSVAEDPEAITRSSSFDTLQFLLKSVSILPTHALSKVFDLVVSALSAEADIIQNDLESDEQDLIQHHKRLLEMYGFLLQWTVSAVETKAAEKPAAAPVARGRGAGKSAKSRTSTKDAAWDPSTQLQTALDIMCKVLKLKLAKLFMTTSERDTFVSLFTRSVYLILESEARVKNTSIRMHTFKVLCIAVKHHGHAFGAQTSIIQNLSYFEHLSEPMAEFLHILSEQYDYPQLADEVLRDLSNKEFNSNDNRGPKSVSTFMIKLSELAPRLVNKQMTMLVKQLDSESYTLRCAIIEVCGNLIADLSKQVEENESHKTQINAFFDVLEERFLDVNPYCRCRCLQVYAKLCDLETKFPKRRQTAAELAARSLEDKSSNVRRNAIKLLGRLIATHPFSVLHGGQLSYKEWSTRLQAVDAELDALKPPSDTPGLAEKPAAGDTTVDDELLDDVTKMDLDDGPEEPKEEQMTEEQQAAAMQKAAEEAATSEQIGRLKLTKRYYAEALRFIEVLHNASEIVCQLLSAKNKSEVIEAMDFFVIIDAYKIETARVGIRRMLRLIWTKGNSDEGKGVQTHLIECYKGLFFEAPDSFSANDAANYIARNMISLTFGATPAELTSLEQLLSTMMKAEHISELVITKLWQVYGVQKKEISRNQRRGAIIVLGMLALADPDIVVREMETMLRIGLGPHGRADLSLAKYTCVALKRMNPGPKKAKESPIATSKLPNDHAVLTKLAAITEVTTDNKEWFGVAEQAIGAIYALSKHPDNLCSDIIRRKTKQVFHNQTQQYEQEEAAAAAEKSGLLSPPPEDTTETPATQQKPQRSALGLSQLLFIVGHVAIKQIVHLEICELDFKRRKAEKEKALPANPSPKKGGNAAVDQDELDLIGGTTEDDFTEAMAHIRERELLYGEHSLLSNFGPLVREICSNNIIYKDRNLQANATLCMAKLMCVSSEYCEANLPLLITILERSKDPIIRSNVVIALGDMAVCFNHLIDENTDFLYRRLNDQDASVKRTCLMTLTFLILAGQVKVKGQLGEMAKCLEDSDRRIADLSRMFFTELATKDNAVYNHFVDMFSLLSAEKNLDDEALRRIIKFLASFIEKDKHAKQLSEKLAARLGRCESERQWNDVTYALSLLHHKNEEIQKTVEAGFRVVQTTA
ncbi:condensin complex component cnd1 [Xylona heveae TC161]|uniref:Condensin complex subunit 1 n=1 Tax=Xylona heveae (strain CBS 132557 / TC161) TaxID=1328760 RepID=A0A165G709_XYLHT|nr:condensin complex component cnd1 [Xylona heveae TC161]KZF21813.1 condensin complex component cnd1 [Xylona heveae TC161]